MNSSIPGAHGFLEACLGNQTDQRLCLLASFNKCICYRLYIGIYLSPVSDNLLKEIMIEVDNLNKSIKELCPEIISMSQYPSIQQQSDEISSLIDHRIKLLTKNSEVKNSEKI